MAIELWTCRLLLACAAGVLAGALLRAALTGLTRHLPAMAQRRSVWLAAQCTVTAIFVLTLAPQTAQLSLLPSLAEPDPAPMAEADLQRHAARLAALPGAADIIPETTVSTAPSAPQSARPPAKDQPQPQSRA